MSTVAFRLDEPIKKKLQHLANETDLDLSVLTRLYVSKAKGRDLDEMTENDMTVAEELELLAMGEEGGDGIVYNSVEELIKSLDE